MQATTIAMLLAGAINLAPALVCLFMALVGGNGLDSARGSVLLGGLLVWLVLAWLFGLFVAHAIVQWGQARSWSALASVAAASTSAMVCFTVLAVVATFIMLIVSGS